jgi:hypothetical protein
MRKFTRHDWLMVWRMARIETLGQMPPVTYMDGREPLHKCALAMLKARELFNREPMLSKVVAS